jgi:hypothetical protein
MRAWRLEGDISAVLDSLVEHFGFPSEIAEKFPALPMPQAVARVDSSPSVRRVPGAVSAIVNRIDELIRKAEKLSVPEGYRKLLMACECGPLPALAIAALLVRIWLPTKIHQSLKRLLFGPASTKANSCDCSKRSSREERRIPGGYMILRDL